MPLVDRIQLTGNERREMQQASQLNNPRQTSNRDYMVFNSKASRMPECPTVKMVEYRSPPKTNHFVLTHGLIYTNLL